jgi:hypothetical protein
MTRSPDTGDWVFEWDEDALLSQAAVRVARTRGRDGGGALTPSITSPPHPPFSLSSLPPLSPQEGVGADVEVLYVGCLPVEVDLADQEVVSLELFTSFRACPVFLGAPLKERYYKRFCKQQLWPLLHYLLPLTPSAAGRFDPDLWQAYVKANKAFADKVRETKGEGREREAKRRGPGFSSSSLFPAVALSPPPSLSLFHPSSLFFPFTSSSRSPPRRTTWCGSMTTTCSPCPPCCAAGRTGPG